MYEPGEWRRCPDGPPHNDHPNCGWFADAWIMVKETRALDMRQWLVDVIERLAYLAWQLSFDDVGDGLWELTQNLDGSAEA